MEKCGWVLPGTLSNAAEKYRKKYVNSKTKTLKYKVCVGDR